MKKYFARINNEQKGPFTLEQLIEEGIRPSTYIWTKGMEHWLHAEDDPDICRAMRHHLADLQSPTSQITQNPQNTDNFPKPEDRARGFRIVRFPWLDGAEFNPETEDFDRKPPGLLAISVLVTIFCFPVTGTFAIYFALLSNRFWRKSNEPDLPPELRRQFRIESHDACRKAKMAIGISFFMALIVFAFAMRTL